MSEPYTECIFCPERCNSRADAELVLQKDPELIANLLKLISLGEHDKMIDASIEKAKEHSGKTSSKEIMGIGYCIIAHTLQELDLPSDLKEKMARTIRLKIGSRARGLNVKMFHPSDTGTSVSSVPTQESGSISTEKNPAGMLIAWIKTDNKFMEDISEILEIGPTEFQIKFNLESEGYLRDITGSVEIFPGENAEYLYLFCTTGLDVAYDYSMVIGPGKKRYCAVSLVDNTKDEDAALAELREVNFKFQMNWDRLAITLNNDKELLKAVSSLPLECPSTGPSPKIRIPVWLNRQGNFTEIRVRTFITKKITPSIVFTGVMETIAEDMDGLRELAPGARATNITVNPDFYKLKETAAPVRFESKFIPKDAQVELKTCPNCHKPLGDNKAEYRRCPHCLFKLM